MKRCLLFIFLLPFVFSCKKEQMQPVVNTGTLIGTWKLVETYYGTGGSGFEYHLVKDSDSEIIEFSTDTHYLNITQNCIGNYTFISDSSIVRLSGGCTFSSVKSAFVKLNSLKDTLILSPKEGPICFEGCGSIYVRTGQLNSGK